METEIPEDDFYEVSVRLFKLTVCEPCGDYGGRIAKIEELEAQAWTELSRLLSARESVKSVRDSGSRAPNLSLRIQKLDGEIEGLRSQIRQLEVKKQKITEGWSQTKKGKK